MLGLYVCHNIIHYGLSILLLVIHSSYGSISNPHSFNVPVSSFQKNAAWKVPYSLRYMTRVPFSYFIHLSYFSGSTCSNKVEIGLSSSMSIISSMSTCTNDPGMLHVVKALCYLDLIIQYKYIDSTKTVDDLISSFVLYTLCFLPSTHLGTLTFTHRLCAKNIRYSSALFLSYLVSIF